MVPNAASVSQAPFTSPVPKGPVPVMSLSRTIAQILAPLAHLPPMPAGRADMLLSNDMGFMTGRSA